MDEDDNSNGGSADDNEFYMAPASESDARAARLLPTEPSEQAGSLLPAIEVPEAAELEPREYLPRTASEWVVYVELVEPGDLLSSDIAALFDSEWREVN